MEYFIRNNCNVVERELGNRVRWVMPGNFSSGKAETQNCSGSRPTWEQSETMSQNKIIEGKKTYTDKCMGHFLERIGIAPSRPKQDLNLDSG